MTSAWLTAVSLAVALVALLLAGYAWLFPRVPDPRTIPTHGTNELDAEYRIGPGRLGEHFVDFLDEHAGAKIRIVTYLDEALYDNVPDDRAPGATGFSLPSSDCPDKPFAELTEQDCTIINVEIRGVSDDKAALWLQHGTWHLQGYFADHGWVDTWMGRTTYRLTVLSDVEAVT